MMSSVLEVGDDSINVGSGSDSADGGDGNDHYVLSIGGADSVTEVGVGTDHLDYSSDTAGITLDLTSDLGAQVARVDDTGETDADGNAIEVSHTVTLTGDFENISTGSGDDNITGSGVDNTLATGSGNDVVSGGDGTDSWTFAGGAGDDVLRLDGDAVAGTLSGTATIDGVVTVSTASTVENIVLDGGSGNDSVFATAMTQAKMDAAGATSLTLNGGDGDDVVKSGQVAGTVVLSLIHISEPTRPY